MDFPSDIKYHKEHTWAKIDNGTATVGITDFAQSQLGDIIFVELPESGSKIEQGESFGTVESAKAASDIISPVTGEVIEVNSELEDSPEKINESPYEDGWMLKVKLDGTGKAENLIDDSKYKEIAK